MCASLKMLHSTEMIRRFLFKTFMQNFTFCRLIKRVFLIVIILEMTNFVWLFAKIAKQSVVLYYTYMPSICNNNRNSTRRSGVVLKLVTVQNLTMQCLDEFFKL